MADLTNKNELIDYLKSHSLWANHGLGQNFLVSKEALDMIVNAAELKSDDTVLEVGPGVGTLTRELTSKVGEVIAIELDEKLAKILAGEFAGSNVQIIHGDILKLNLNEIVDRDYKVVANIPYYITSKIIALFLTAKKKPSEIILLVQKEVAERICAKSGEMSVLAVSVQIFGEPEIVGIVKKDSFFPAPKVDSAILRIRIHALEAMTKDQEKNFFRLVHIGFAARRKTLSNNLSSGYHIDKKTAEAIIKSAGLPPNIRAQDLSLDQWQALLAMISNHE